MKMRKKEEVEEVKEEEGKWEADGEEGEERRSVASLIREFLMGCGEEAGFGKLPRVRRRGCDFREQGDGSLERHKADAHDIDLQRSKCDQCDYNSKKNRNIERRKACQVLKAVGFMSRSFAGGEGSGRVKKKKHSRRHV